MRLGFIGTGIITSAMVTGFCKSEGPPDQILVSPRNAEKAAALAERFSQIEVAADNQSVVDGSDVVFLAVTSQVAHDVIEPLRFRADHCVVSLMALSTLAQIREMVAPASTIYRAVPLPPVALGVCPIVQCPPDATLHALLDSIGTVVEVEDEMQLSKLNAVTALMAPFYGLLDRTQKWLTRQNIDGETASRYVAALFHGLALDATKVGAEGFEAVVADAQTPGGLNEQALRRLTEAGWYDEIDQVLEVILARVTAGIAMARPGGPES